MQHGAFEDVRIEGHLIDSGIVSRVMDHIIAMGGEFDRRGYAGYHQPMLVKSPRPGRGKLDEAAFHQSLLSGRGEVINRPFEL